MQLRSHNLRDLDLNYLQHTIYKNELLTFSRILALLHQFVVRTNVENIDKHLCDCTRHNDNRSSEIDQNFYLIYQVLASSLNAPFSPTNGNDQVNTSIKFGSQYG